MAGPWEQYAAPTAPTAETPPWEQYAAPATPEAAPTRIAMPQQDFQVEVLKRARAGETPEAIRAFADTVRNPDDPTGRVGYVLGPELEQVVGQLQSGYPGPVQFLDTTEGDPFGAALRGGADALTLNNADEITAGFKSLFGQGSYEDLVRQERAQRTIDARANPNERLAGEAAGMIGGAMIPMGGVLNAEKLLGMGGRLVRGAGFGAATGAAAGYGAAQSNEEALDRLPGDIVEGGLLGAAIPVVGGAASYVGNRVTDTGSAVSMLESLGLSPAMLRAEAAKYTAATGKPATVAAVIGPSGERLRAPLAAAQETRYAAADQAETAGRRMLEGTRERASSVQMAEEAQAASSARARDSLLDPAFDPEYQRGALQRGLRRRMEGVPAASTSELNARVREIDKTNYGAVEKQVVPLSEEDRIIVRDILAETPMASATKSGTRTEDGIAQRLENNALTGLDFQVIRENLLAGPRGVVVKTGKTFQNLAEDLDAVIDANLPDMTAARRASFEARSVTEGAAAAQGAVKELGANPVTEAADLRMLTPEQRAGVPLGGAQGVLDRTSDPTKAYKFSEKLAIDPDYAANVRSVLPPGVGDTLIGYASGRRAAIEQLDMLGLPGAGGDPAKFKALTKKLLEDRAFTDTLRRQVPKELVDDLVNYARVQREFLDKVDDLGLNKIADDVAKSYNFADRVVSDPAYRDAVVAAMPEGVGSELVGFAVAQKRAVDNLTALAGVPAESVPPVLNNASDMVKVAVIAAQGGGAAIVSGVISRGLEGLGIGRGAALKLSEMLFEPGKFESTMRMLEKRGASRAKVTEFVRNGFFLLAAQADKDNTRAPEGAVTVEPQ